MNFDSILRGLERRRWFVLSGICFWVILEFGYRYYVAPIYGYSGFEFSPSVIKYFEAWFLYLSLLFLAPCYCRRPSDYFIVFLLFGLLTPLLIFYALADQIRLSLYIVILGYFLVDLFRRGKPLKIPGVKGGFFVSVGIMVVGAVIVSAWLILSGGIAHFNLDLTSVYVHRRVVGDTINAGPMGYLNTWAFKVFGPALLTVALWKRWFGIALIVLGLHVFWFGVSSKKAVLFYPFLILFLWIWFRKTKALGVISVGMGSVVLATLIVYGFSDYGLPASLFLRRTFFGVANNTFDYYLFFSANDFVYWSNSISSAFIEYPYNLGYAQLIGAWRGTDSHVNNTFLSTGYMHAGAIGVVFYGILAGLLFRFVDSISAGGVPLWVSIGVLMVASRALLLSADLPTAILSHGIGIALILLLFIRQPVKMRRIS